MLGQVSALSIAGMVVSLVLAVGLPVAGVIFWKKKANAKVTSMLIGLATFIVAAMVLEQMFHKVVLTATGTLITGNIWLYALYGGLCAGLFEETGRFIAMKYCMKHSLDRDNAVMYGIGHGGIEAVLLCGVSMVSNIIMSVMINTGALEGTLNMLDEATRADTVDQISALWTTAPYLFCMGGIERVSAFFLQIALSYLIYLCVRNRKAGLYILAVFIHMAIDTGTVLLFQVMSIPILEAIIMAAALLLWVCIYKVSLSKEKNEAKEAALDSGTLHGTDEKGNL